MENLVTSYPNLSKEFWEGRTVLVTGHTGFKGSWLSLWLNELGAKVVGVSLGRLPGRSMFTYVCSDGGCPVSADECVDIRDSSEVCRVFSKYNPEIVFHLAAQSLVLSSYQDPLETFSTNVMGTANVLNAAIQTESVRVVINVTSDKCYSNNEEQILFRESDRLGGADPYSASKACAELVASSFGSSFFESKNKALISVRAGNVIGGGDWASYRLVPDLVDAAVNRSVLEIRSPHAVRPWQHVLDPLSGYIAAAERAFSGQEMLTNTFNFGPDLAQIRSVDSFCRAFFDSWGCGANVQIEVVKIVGKEANFLGLDSFKARRVLGWQPVWQFDQAIDKTVEWYQMFEKGESVKNLSVRQIREYMSDSGVLD